MPSKIKALCWGSSTSSQSSEWTDSCSGDPNDSLPNHAVQVVTPFGETSASVTRLDPSPDLLIAIAKDTLRAQDNYPKSAA